VHAGNQAEVANPNSFTG